MCQFKATNIQFILLPRSVQNIAALVAALGSELCVYLLKLAKMVFPLLFGYFCTNNNWSNLVNFWVKKHI